MGSAADTASHIENRDPSTMEASSEPEKQQPLTHDAQWLAAQRRYLRRLDLIILPMISTLYFFEYLDRANIGNAKLYGYSKGHETKSNGVGPGQESLTSPQWQLVVMIFYVGLVLCQVPGTIGYRIFPPSKWIAFGVCGWALTSILQVTAQNLSSALACRVFIGAFEGLFGTGIVYYLSLWYHRTEMGIRVFWFLGPTAIAGAFGGLIAFGVGHIYAHLPTWKWLFIIEALPALLLGLSCLYWMPDRPLSNSRFSGIDQEIAEARYVNESFDKAGAIQRKHIVWTLTDWKLYAQTAVYLPTAALLSSISGFLPTIVSGLGYHDPAKANLMTVPPYAAAFALMLVVSYTSDRYKERGLHIAVVMVGAIVAYACLAFLADDHLRAKYACVCIAVACVYATYPPSHAWAANNFGNETKRAIGMGLYTAMGNLGSIAGSFLYPAEDGPQFQRGHLIAMGLAIATSVFSVANKMALKAVNTHRNTVNGRPVEGATVDVTELADRHPSFRFIT